MKILNATYIATVRILLIVIYDPYMIQEDKGQAPFSSPVTKDCFLSKTYASPVFLRTPKFCRRNIVEIATLEDSITYFFDLYDIFFYQDLKILWVRFILKRASKIITVFTSVFVVKKLIQVKPIENRSL